MKRFNLILLVLAIGLFSLSGCGSSKEKTTVIKQEEYIFLNTTTHVPVNVPVATALAVMTKNITYADQTVESGRVNVMIASGVLSANTTTGITNEKILIDFRIKNGFWQQLKNVQVRSGATIIGETYSQTSFGGENHTALAFEASNYLPAGTAIPVQVYADIDMSEIDTQFYTTMRAEGTTDLGEAYSTKEIDGQMITIGKSDVAITNINTSVTNGAVANSEVLFGKYQFEAVPEKSLRSMSFTVYGAESVNRIKVYKASTSMSNPHPELMGEASVEMDKQYGNGSANIVFATPLAIDANLTLFAMVELNDQTGAMVSASLSRYTINGVNSSASYTVDENGSWFKTVKSLPAITAMAIPSNILVEGVNTIYNFWLLVNNNDASWKKTPTIEVKSSPGLTLDYVLYDSNANVVPTKLQKTIKIDSDGSMITSLSFMAIDEQIISANCGKTYTIKAIVSGEIKVGSYVSTIFKKSDGSSNYWGSNNFANIAENESFIWSDMSAYGHSIETWDWFDDSLIEIPNFNQTLSK